MSQLAGPSTDHRSPGRKPAGGKLWLLLGLAAGLTITALWLAAVVLAGFLWLSSNTGGAETAPTADSVVTMPEATAPGSLAAAVNRIAFVTPDGRLGTVAPDGSVLRMLTPQGLRFQFPAWSPDSTRLAAIGSDGESAGVFVLADRPATPAESGQLQPLYRSAALPPFYLYWSPNGQQISFLANDPRGIALHLAPADGSANSRILTTGRPFYWQWAQDSTRLLIHADGLGDNARLVFVDTEGQPVSDPVAVPGLFQAPGISPSGRYLAFAAAEGEHLQLVVQRSGGSERVAALPQSGSVALSWSPVADQLAFSGGERGLLPYGSLRLLDPASGDIRVLSHAVVVAFFWSPDGRTIAYLARDADRDTPGAGRWDGLAGKVTRTYQPVSDSVPQHSGVVLKLWIVDVASGEQRLLSGLRPTELFISQFLPYFDQYALSHRLWSPTSDALVIPMVDSNGQDRIYVVSAEGGPPRAVADGPIGFWSQR